MACRGYKRPRQKGLRPTPAPGARPDQALKCSVWREKVTAVAAASVPLAFPWRPSPSVVHTSAARRPPLPPRRSLSKPDRTPSQRIEAIAMALLRELYDILRGSIAADKTDANENRDHSFKIAPWQYAVILLALLVGLGLGIITLFLGTPGLL